jgi:hypothetical protein
MTIDELTDRLSTYPRDAHITGYVEPDGKRPGLLVVWNNDGQIRTVFIETSLLPHDLQPASPKKAHAKGD